MNDFTHVVQVNSILFSKLHYLLCLRTLAAALQASMIRSFIHCDTVASLREKYALSAAWMRKVMRGQKLRLESSDVIRYDMI